MGATTRGAAHRKAEAEATNILQLPDAALERILIAASDGGEWGELRSARLVCTRLRAASYSAVRALTASIDFEVEPLAPLALLPRLGGLNRLQLEIVFDDGFDSGIYSDSLRKQADGVAQAVCESCPGLAELWIRSQKNKKTVFALAHAFGLLGPNAAPPQPPPLLRLTSLSLDWPGTLRGSLAPLARLTRLTALELRGHAEGAKASDWLPPNLQDLHLGVNEARYCNRLRGIGGTGWLAALNAGSCPQLRALHVSKVGMGDVCPLMLASALPRLAALEELLVRVYDNRNRADLDWRWYRDASDPETDDDARDDPADKMNGHAWFDAWPVPAAPLLAALPNLRHFQAELILARLNFDEHGDYFNRSDVLIVPMLYASPADLATLHAPRLESLRLGLSRQKSSREELCFCSYGSSAAVMDSAPAGAAAAASSAASGAGSSGLPALRSLDLYVGCNREGYREDAFFWDLSGLTPNSLPALRRLQVLPRCFDCCAAKLPLDAVARAAPGLERLVIEPPCAGLLDALFCDGGCGVLSLRSLEVLPLPPSDAAAVARIDAELRAGLRARGAALRHAGDAAPPLKVTTLFTLGGAPPPRAAAMAARADARGATVVRRPQDDKDAVQVDFFLLTGLRRGTLPKNAREDPYGVESYEREHA